MDLEDVDRSLTSIKILFWWANFRFVDSKLCVLGRLVFRNIGKKPWLLIGYSIVHRRISARVRHEWKHDGSGIGNIHWSTQRTSTSRTLQLPNFDDSAAVKWCSSTLLYEMANYYLSVSLSLSMEMDIIIQKREYEWGSDIRPRSSSFTAAAVHVYSG